MEHSPRELLATSDLLYSSEEVATAISRVAREIAAVLADDAPLVLCVMNGATLFSGQLLPYLAFPLEFDYVQASRYHNKTTGSDDIRWKMPPGENVQGRTVLLLDDILDEGHTLAAVRARCLEAGAARVLIAVLTEKDNGLEKPIAADFVGLQVPNRYVFGCGMDVYGWWRNLPDIRVLNQ